MTTDKSQMTNFIQRYGFYLLAVILLLTIAVTSAEPVKDGDFFWQMEYGRYLIENKTIIPDHTLYSWTPATNDIIYCAWIGEIVFYLLFKVGGLPLVFAFRYFCVLALLSVVWIFARGLGRGKHILTFFVLVVVLLANGGATYLKPEIMSMVYMALTGGLYFSVKASLWGRWGTRPFLLYPILFLLWVNTHGVFVFGMMLLAAITIGEILNYRYRTGSSLPGQGIRHLLTGVILSVAATLVNPYGIGYHISLYHSYLAPTDNLRMTTVGAFVSPFDIRASRMHYPEILGIMALAFLVMFAFFIWKKRSCDWAVLLPNLFLAWMASRYLRSVFYWPAFWGMSVIYLSQILRPYWPRLPKATMVLKGLILLVPLLLACRASYEAVYNPVTARWCGFGIGYLNPVHASAFLKKYRPGKYLYNSYDIGGYLIHDLYPTYKIFCDPRAFPYADWYGEYWNFNSGSTALIDFSKKYPFDVAVVDYRSSESPIVKFLRSRDWEPVFYGPVAIVFVRNDVDFTHDYRKLDKHRFDQLRHLGHATMAFNIAASLGDLETSGYILALIKKRFSPWHKNYLAIVDNISVVQNGLVAYAKQDYETAWENLSKIDPDHAIIRVNLVIFHLRNWKCKQLVKEGKLRESLELAEAIVRQRPNYVDGLYNAGILGYQVELIEKEKKKDSDPNAMWRAPTMAEGSIKKLGNQEREKYRNNGFISKFEGTRTNWRNYLQLFLSLAPDHRYAWIAKQVLEGRGLPPTVTLIL